MIIYDKTYKISAVGDAALKILGFDSADEFLSSHKDLNELSPEFSQNQNQSFIELVLNSPKSSLALNLMTKNHQLISVIAHAQTINFIDGQKMYELELIPQNSLIELDVAENESGAVRLPIIRQSGAKMERVGQILLDEKWFEQTMRFLNLNDYELSSYLKILLNALNKEIIALQNAVLSQDTLMIKKITSLIKEPSMNLKIMPLVKICDALPNASIDEFALLIRQLQACAKNIGELVNKYEGDM